MSDKTKGKLYTQIERLNEKYHFGAPMILTNPKEEKEALDAAINDKDEWFLEVFGYPELGYPSQEQLEILHKSEPSLEALFNEAKAELPTRAAAEKVAKERIGRELRHDGFDVALIACIHAELFGKWADKWFGAT